MMLVSETVNTTLPVNVVESLPDADGIAADVIAQAFKYCAQKLGLADERAALDCLRSGDAAAGQYCAYGIVQHVAQTLGAWDDHVRSVYVIDYDATPDDLCFACDGRALPVHVIVWTTRKTRALDALIAGLDRALVQHYRGQVEPCGLEHILDAQVIDDADVKGRIGYGAMLVSIHQRPIQVWSR
jgi:hypothetical protein